MIGVIRMDRDSYLNTIRDRSQFEENAASKISDARTHESVITDVNVTTSHSISSARTIAEKLKEYKNDKPVSAEHDHGTVGEYRTETEIHGLVDPENPSEPDNTVKANDNTVNVYATAASKAPDHKSRKGRYDRSTRQHSNQQTGNVSAKYNSALRDEGVTQAPHSQSSNFKGGQMRNSLSETGSSSGKKSGSKYSGPGAAERLSSYSTTTVATAGKSKVTNTVNNRKSRSKQEKGRTDKYGNIIPSRISSKAKGTTETKAKNISKTKNLQKDALEKKVNGTKSSSGKFQKKIGTDRRKNNKSKVRNAAVTAVNYKLGENTDQVQNSSVEAARASAGAGYAMYSRFNRRRNNLNAQKFLHKSKAYKSAKGGAAGASGIKKSSGKYGGKASKSFTQAQANQRKAQAAKRAMQAKQAKKFRQAKAKEKQILITFEEVKNTAIKVAKKLVEFARRNATITITVAIFLITFIAVSAGLGSCAMALTSGSSTYMSGLSGAVDPAMTDCDSYFTEKEMNLQERIDNIQEEYPDYEEYIFDVDEIGHDSIKMMAFLSSVYDSYDLDKVKGVLDEIFDDMYKLTITPKVEKRIRSVFNPDTGKYEDKEVDVKVLYITLRKKAWDDVIAGRFPDDSAKERYEIYDDTDGAHQAFYNPFTIDWSKKITSRFGWRVHPILGREKFHNGIDIGMPAGTEIHACASGKVITATYSNTAGNYVVIQDATGYTTHYMHMTSYNVSVGQMVKHGDIIGKVGSTGRSTGPHLHLGIKDEKGNWLNPEFMVSTYTGGSH